MLGNTRSDCDAGNRSGLGDWRSQFDCVGTPIYELDNFEQNLCRPVNGRANFFTDRTLLEAVLNLAGIVSDVRTIDRRGGGTIKQHSCS